MTMRDLSANEHSKFPQMPFVAKHVLGITALCSLLTFPICYPIYVAFKLLMPLLTILKITNHNVAPPMILVFTFALIISIIPPLEIGARLTSRWLVQAIRYFIDCKEQEQAKDLLTSYAHALKFRDLKKHIWLQEFIAENNLGERNQRIQTFLKKIGN